MGIWKDWLSGFQLFSFAAQQKLNIVEYLLLQLFWQQIKLRIKGRCTHNENMF